MSTATAIDAAPETPTGLNLSPFGLQFLALNELYPSTPCRTRARRPPGPAPREIRAKQKTAELRASGRGQEAESEDLKRRKAQEAREAKERAARELTPKVYAALRPELAEKLSAAVPSTMDTGRRGCAPSCPEIVNMQTLRSSSSLVRAVLVLR